MNESRAMIRTMVRGAYDLQKLRIMFGNRLVGNFKAKLGQLPSTKEEEMDAEGKRILAQLRESYRRITDGVTKLKPSIDLGGDPLITTFTELCLVAQYVELLGREEEHFRRLKKILEDYRIWSEFLKDVCGVGPAMAGVLISEIDIHKARHPSSLWKYAGLDVAEDGAGRSRRSEHLVKAEYVNKGGEAATRNSITFNPFLKTKLFVLATSFLKQSAERCQYRGIYDDYKHRLESHARYGVQNDGMKNDKGHQFTSKGRRHNMAMRYMVKMFLIDLYTHWRSIEGLPVSKPYHEAKLGMVHGQDAA